MAELLSGEKAVRVHGAWIRGQLHLDGIDCAAGLRLTGTRVDSPAGPAVLATGLVVDGSAFTETLDARGASPARAVCFTGATIADDLVLQGARLIAQSADASARGMLTRLSRTLRLARAPHPAAPYTVPVPRLTPPPAGTESP